MLLVILVLAISMMVGWYGEKAVEKFTANSGEAGQIQNI